MERKIYDFYTEGNAARQVEYETRTEKRVKGTNRGRQTNYVRGNAAPARRYEEVEVPAPVRRNRRKKQLSPKQLRQMERESTRARYLSMQSESMGLGYVLFLACMVVVIALLAVQYLNFQADVAEKKSNINTLKSQIEVQASQNDAVSYEIDAYIDINRIIDVATNELGMVMANEDQVKYFEKHVDEFMNQYADVPEE